MPVGNLSASLARCYERLLAVVAANPGWVAFSGGVDSTLVLKAANEVNSLPVMALFADSPLQSEFDRDHVKRLADQLGWQLVAVPFDPLAWPEFTANPGDRCYLCKKAIYSRFLTLLPIGAGLLDGTNGDDCGAVRPGYRAVVELGVVSPLVVAGLPKSEVRQLARWLGLPNWNRPSSSCLATRIPEGVKISENLLRRIEVCEALVRRHVLGHIRVRLVGGRPDDLVVELAKEEIARADFSVIGVRIREDLERLLVRDVIFSGREKVFLGQY